METLLPKTTSTIEHTSKYTSAPSSSGKIPSITFRTCLICFKRSCTWSKAVGLILLLIGHPTTELWVCTTFLTVPVHPQKAQAYSESGISTSDEEYQNIERPQTSEAKTARVNAKFKKKPVPPSTGSTGLHKRRPWRVKEKIADIPSKITTKYCIYSASNNQSFGRSRT